MPVTVPSPAAGKRIRPRWIGLALAAATAVSAQQVTTKVKVYSDIFVTDAGLVPPPGDAIELERLRTFESGPFRAAPRLARDSEGRLIVLAGDGSAVYRCDDSEGSLSLFAALEREKTNRPPAGVAAFGSRLIVHDAARSRLDVLDDRGRCVSSRKVPLIRAFAADGQGRVFAALPVRDAKSPLVTVYPPQGRETAFGMPLVFVHNMARLNSISLSVDDRGYVFVAFTYLPLVRKYSPGGILLAEFGLDTPSIKAKEEYNLKVIGEAVAEARRNAGVQPPIDVKPVILDIESVGGRVFVLSAVPRLEITVLDDEGQPGPTYWMETQDMSAAGELVVGEAGGEPRFYVTRMAAANHVIDVLGVKPPPPEGLAGEILKLTDELAAFPDNPIALNNRGEARYRAGDYEGALADFARAAELKPDWAAARNNLGLARVKTGDPAAAVRDFSRALDLDPTSAAVFFNRGIALVHLREFEKAIRDFETSAALDSAFETKAREQIDFCRRRRVTRSAATPPARRGPSAGPPPR